MRGLICAIALIFIAYSLSSIVDELQTMNNTLNVSGDRY